MTLVAAARNQKENKMKITRKQLRQIIRESIREEVVALEEVSLQIGSDVAQHLANRLRAMAAYANANPDKIPPGLQRFADRNLLVRDNSEAIAMIQHAEPHFERMGIDIYDL